MFIQRQCSSIVIPGDDTSASAQGMAEKVYDSSDTYPANIMVVVDNKLTSGEISIAALGSQDLPLPSGGYATGTWCSIFISCDAIAKIVTASADHATSTQLIKAWTNSEGLCVYMDTGVTTITVTNLGSAAAITRYFIFQYPEDLDDNDAWRSGSQTTGIL